MKKKIMLVSSSGGHWVQLNRLNIAFQDCEKIYITTEPRYRPTVGQNRFIIVPDASRWNKVKILWLALLMFKHILFIRPDVVISTGAAPGFLAIFWGKVFRAKTIWIDSIANIDELSMSGRKVGKYADLWLTQWEHLARPEGPQFVGAVL
jgi:UDP-N-acetylglucosamine:LPS N-acetylglucosamine transferase